MLNNAIKKGFQSIEEYFHKYEPFRLCKLSEGFTRANFGNLDILARSPPAKSKYKGAELKAAIDKKNERLAAKRAAVSKVHLTPASKHSSTARIGQSLS